MTLGFGFAQKAKIYFICIALCITVEVLAGLVTQISVNTWYNSLIKPFFTPPKWLFAPVWGLLYLMMGFAWGKINVSAKLLSSEHSESLKANLKKANALFIIQLICNLLWSVIYFGFNNIFFALIDIILLWIILFFTICQFFKISKLAGWILTPYLLWTSYAAILNASIWYLNS